MMIVNVNDKIGFFQESFNAGQAAFLPGIDDNKSLGVGEVNRSRVCHIEQISHGVNEKVPEIFLLGAGKNNYTFRIQLLCGKHGANRIKIRIHMAGYDRFGGNFLFFWGHRITPVEMHFANLYSISVLNLQCSDNPWSYIAK